MRAWIGVLTVLLVGAPAVSDALTQGTPNAGYSLVSRDVVADCFEIGHRAHHGDGRVLASELHALALPTGDRSRIRRRASSPARTTSGHCRVRGGTTIDGKSATAPAVAMQRTRESPGVGAV